MQIETEARRKPDLDLFTTTRHGRAGTQRRRCHSESTRNDITQLV
jgi:hypothetical protein